jgi:broad specificity phosphatase PhoE
MGTVPISVWNHFPSADNRDGLVARADQAVLPDVMERHRTQFGRLQEQDPYFMDKILRTFRIFKTVYCPSTPRHVESAELICELFKLPSPIPDARMNAINYGDFLGKPFSALDPPHTYIERPYPDGESWMQCLARWRSFFEDKLQKHSGIPVLLAGQARAAIRMCAHLCDGIPLADAVDLEINDATVPWVYTYIF